MLYGGWDQLQTPMSKSRDVDQARFRLRHDGVAVVFLNLPVRG
jgi:hypothetical protein